MKAIKILTRILEILTVLTFSALIIVVLIQIIGRYTPLSYVWTEELTRYLFVYTIAFGAPVAMERRGYIRVDLLVDFLPEKFKKYYDAFIYLVLGAFSAMLVTYAYDFALLGEGQTSATIKVEMFYIYLSMVIALVFLAIYSFVNIYHILMGNTTEEKEEGVEV
ncbi:TRAP transporter small permease [Virgibacillus oceani]|uniref:TRAP transporter small permease protein n=1 Tax=Virgibacillus oceani TaxID=1479511 RepID=A0A917HMB0_9BACI|nr:TRAP transporter small permease [Virgibacillus oceani]GGG83038.1 TRAP transporter small permease protein [Virgibacillus oceani]